YLDSLNFNSNVDIKYVLGNWRQSIRYKPDTLQDIETYKVLIKILLIGIMSPKLMSSFLELFRKIKQTKKLQIQP
ncbi:glycosyltransferase family 2 protein, partial [Nostoc sp. NIES-2111]